MLKTTPAESVELVRRLLTAAAAKSADVAAQLHPAWLDSVWQRMHLPMPRPPASATQSAALARIYGLRWTSLARFANQPERVALLPRLQMLRVLAAIALHLERDRVRHSISRGARTALIDAVGEAAYVGILAMPPLDRSGSSSNSFITSEIDLEQLAERGFAAIYELLDWNSRTTLMWVRLALAPRHVAPPRKATASDTAHALKRLAIYFPEHSWLFGSHMDRTLSDLKPA